MQIALYQPARVRNGEARDPSPDPNRGGPQLCAVLGYGEICITARIGCSTVLWHLHARRERYRHLCDHRLLSASHHRSTAVPRRGPTTDAVLARRALSRVGSRALAGNAGKAARRRTRCSTGRVQHPRGVTLACHVCASGARQRGSLDPLPCAEGDARELAGRGGTSP